MEKLSVVLVLVLVGFVLYMVDTRQRSRWRDDHVAQFLCHFEAKRRTVHFAPIEAAYYGSPPDRTDTTTTRGGFLCAVDRQLLATGHHVDRWDICVPFHKLCWIGTASIRIRLTNRFSPHVKRKCALVVSCDSRGGRAMYAWTACRQNELGITLANLCELLFDDLGTEEDDFGPKSGIRMT